MSDLPTPGSSATTEPVVMTREGHHRLAGELTQLTTVQRPALVRRARQARLFLSPDASAGAESLAAYDLDIVDRRIKLLTDLLDRVQVIPEPPVTGTVQLGAQVQVRYDDDTEETLTLVGPLEADLSRGFISNESPVGKALIGKMAGDTVSIADSGETLRLTIGQVRAAETT